MDANVFLITGNDGPTIEAAARKLVREVAGDEPDAFALEIIRERDGATVADIVHEVVRALRSPPFLGGHKTVWLQNFHGFSSEGSRKDSSPEATAFRELAGIITEGIGEDMVLIMNGPGADQRKALCRACKEKGVLRVAGKPDIRDRRNWEADMRRLVRQAADRKGVDLPQPVLDYLVAALGTDTVRIETELEKLICYCGGPDSPITIEAAREICLSEGETISWALQDAVGDRNVAAALQQIDTLLQREKDPEGAVMGLLVQMGNYLRHLLEVKLFMHRQRLRNPQNVMRAVENLSPEARAAYEKQGMDVVGFNTYRVRLLAQRALHFQGGELVRGLVGVRDAYRKCVSSTASNRIALEKLIIDICGPPVSTSRGTQVRAGRC
ncbi:MAG: hypothetical protein GXP31_00055 [Kiritimatiellaeota bacterium]|nr:hypothetical protein [Kiritimatiellota bacterium]